LGCAETTLHRERSRFNTMDISLIIAAALISVLGLPHGALDPVVAQRIGLWKSWLGLSVFLTLYVVLAAAMIALWLYIPIIGFVIFLAVSVIHFGRDYQRYQNSIWQQIAYGAFVLGLPTLFHPEGTQEIFDYLLFGHTPMVVIWSMQIGGILGAIVLASRLKLKQPIAITELTVLFLVAWLLSPLWYFVVFFCLMHSPRHLLPIFQQYEIQNRGKGLLVIVAITIVTLLLGAIAAYVFQATAISQNALLLQIIFIGLAGLTMPHMILIEWARRQTIG